MVTTRASKKRDAEVEAASANKYVSRAGKTHFLFLLQTFVPWILQLLEWLPEESSIVELNEDSIKKLMPDQCFMSQGGVAKRIHAMCLVNVVKGVLPTLCTSCLIIITASSAIYGGSWRSVRDAATAKSEDAPVSMTKSDAMRFPMMGSIVLLSLFTAIKLLPKELLTVCLGLYFMLLGTFAITATIVPFVEDCLPSFISKREINLGFLNRLPKNVRVALFETEEDLSTIKVTGSDIVSGIASLAFCYWYQKTRHWVANNAIGLSFCVQGIEMLSLGSVQVGMILLSGLFFYDIFWVFFTPVMVTVAKSFDAPIKLLFLKSVTEGKPTFSMLGLGDIVIPGIYLALLLRMDHKRGFDKSNYFTWVFISYCGGLLATLVVMHVFQHAQPALLYLVPACLGSTFIVALFKKEVMFIFNYSEEEEEEEGDKKKEE